ncbi:MAG: Asp23/Gls24 family envelope stress response protein [Lachnospiraceae bacterium]|nr:Asp23/Gls24 family envelope stress response protein [Lachnospiraceae bacterium]
MGDIANKEVNNEAKIGNISIADGVVASIAGIAAIEVEGVSKLTGNISKELVSKLGKKNLANGVKIEIIDGVVTADISVEIMYGSAIKKVSEEIQVKVKQAIETMTGLKVGIVNVVVSGIKLDKN